MSQLPTPDFNYQKSDYNLKSLLDLLEHDISYDLNCHAIGTIQGFNPANQTASVSINYTKIVNVPDPSAPSQDQNPAYIQKAIPYPKFADCPVVIMGGGSSYLTFPIAIGDECLVLFNDRDIDNWFATGQVAPPATGRLHSFSDAIVLVGLRSTLRSISNYDTTRAVITNGAVQVGINPNTNLATIKNAVTTLNTALQELITGIQGATAGGSPIVDVTGKISSASTALAALLE